MSYENSHESSWSNVQLIHSAVLRHMLVGILGQACGHAGSKPWHQSTSGPDLLHLADFNPNIMISESDNSNPRAEWMLTMRLLSLSWKGSPKKKPSELPDLAFKPNKEQKSRTVKSSGMGVPSFLEWHMTRQQLKINEKITKSSIFSQRKNTKQKIKRKN